MRLCTGSTDYCTSGTVEDQLSQMQSQKNYYQSQIATRFQVNWKSFVMGISDFYLKYPHPVGSSEVLEGLKALGGRDLKLAIGWFPKHKETSLDSLRSSTWLMHHFWHFDPNQRWSTKYQPSQTTVNSMQTSMQTTVERLDKPSAYYLGRVSVAETQCLRHSGASSLLVVCYLLLARFSGSCIVLFHARSTADDSICC